MRACLFYEPNLEKYDCYFWDKADVSPPNQQPVNMAELAHRLHSAEAYHLDIILPERFISSRQIELPHISPKKARQALGFALEEDIASPLEAVHWSFSRNDFGYMVRVIDKPLLQQLHDALAEYELQAQSLVCPSMLLPKNSVFLLPDTLLCTQPECTGAIPYAHAELIPNDALTCYRFVDSPIENSQPKLLKEPVHTEIIPLNFQHWLVERLPSSPGEANLLQGEFEPKTQKLALRFWQFLCLGLLCACLISALGLSVFTYLHNRATLAALNSAIEVDYKHFFPNATQVISPKFRVEQLLKSRSSGSNALFWLYLKAMSQANRAEVSLLYVHFQDQKARLKISTRNFTSLKIYSQKLQQDGIKVKQLKANTEGNRVLAELELFR